MALFTKENAAIFGRRGSDARWKAPVAIPEPIANPPAADTALPATDGGEHSDFVQRRLTRVREQLDRLDAMMAKEKNSKTLKELADATARLSEQERMMAGRPAPGSLKPSNGRAELTAAQKLLVRAPRAPRIGPPPADLQG